jgi:DNA-binding SARP family transcriptional activator
MDLALQASERIGSPYLLLAALRDFPAVVSRRIDAEPSEDSVWHQLGRQLLKPHGECTVPLTPVVRVCDFGPAQIFVGDVPQKPRIAKSVELLVYLICAPEQRASRDEILDDLFEGRADESTKSYLRQAVARLREILPDGVLQTSRSAIALKAGAVSSDSLRFRQMVDESGRLGKQEAVALLTDAFALSDRGEFLEGARSIWAESHREALARLALEARLDAADWAFDLGSYRQAEALVDAVVQRDPYRERAWRLRMKLLGALGDSDALVRCYQRCSATLASIGLEPAPSTRRLVDHLRR